MSWKRRAGPVGRCMATGSFGYDDALRALRSALTFGINPSLDGIRAIAEELGRPQDAFTCVQVTGTNGKSSVVWSTAALLAVNGFRTGAYTSPELHSYTERIEVDGTPVGEDAFAAGIAAVLDAAARAGVEPTEFELLTAAALWIYRECSVDIAVLEVGMGGRWDATSAAAPAVAAVSSVGVDHGEHLGATREEIAADKAHVIVTGSLAVLGPGTAGVDEAFMKRAEEVGVHPGAVRAVRAMGTPTPVADETTVRYRVISAPESADGTTRFDVCGMHADYLGLELCAPSYQAANVATAVAAAEAVVERAPGPGDDRGRATERALDPGHVREAVADVRFPGRFEVLGRDPWVVADGAHNPQAATALAEAVRDAFGDRAPVAVLGVLADKDTEGIVTALAPVVAGFVCVAPRSPRALPVAELAAVVERVTGCVPQVADRVAEGVALALAEGAPVIATGSIRTAAEARRPTGTGSASSAARAHRPR